MKWAKNTLNALLQSLFKTCLSDCFQFQPHPHLLRTNDNMNIITKHCTEKWKRKKRLIKNNKKKL